jgi:hypothetical protein
MSSSLAACLVILASIAWFTFAPQRATAAESLATAAAATQAYKGWVHIRGRPEAGTTQPVHADSSNMYLDRATGTTINDYTIDGRRQIEMWDVTNNQQLLYDSEKKQIEIGDTFPSSAKSWAAESMRYPITLAETVASYKRLGEPKAELKIEQSTESGLQRLEISFPKNTSATSTAPTTAEAGVVRASHVTMWIDPQSNLIQKVTSLIDGEVDTVEYVYGEPIKDLYDLGVPRDTKIVDNRVKGDVNALFERLQKRYEKGFGDFVALVHEMDPEHPDRPDREGAVQVYAASGQKWLNARYLVGRKQYAPGQPRDVAIEPLDTWPPKDCKVVLDRVKDAVPSDCLISDGKHVWQGYGASRKDYQTSELTGRMAQTIDVDRGHRTLAGFTWPTRVRLGVFGADAKASIITDAKNHPGQLGLHVEQMLFVTDMTQKQLDVDTYWLDPSRDDMPIEWKMTQYEKDGKTISTDSTVTFLEWKQLPNGQWYPTRWTSDFVSNEGGRSIGNKQAFHLAMCPGEKLGDEWFTNPAAKLKR